MFVYRFRYVLILAAITLLAAGCAPAETTAGSAPSIAPAPTTAPAGAPSPAATTAPAGSAGTDRTTIRLVAIPDKSEARYRVREQLAGVSLPSDAIGRTKSITGTIVGKMDGSIVEEESKFMVDLRTLQSDESRRDNFLRNNVLHTNQYPNAVFVPKQTEGLPFTLPPASEVSFKLMGDLTIRNVTKPVAWDVVCRPQGEQGTCTATTSFDFPYFGLTQPRVPVVLSVQDTIRLEVDLGLQRATN